MRARVVVLLPEVIKEVRVGRFISCPVQKVCLDMLFNLRRISNKLVW